MIKARLNTTNFCFEAYGSTADKARAALIAGLKTHAKQYRIERPDWWVEWEEEIYITPIQLNAAYRDSEQIKDQS